MDRSRSSGDQWVLHHRCVSCNVSAFVLCSFGTMGNSATFCCVAGWRWAHHHVDYGIASGSRLAQQDGCGEFSDPHDGDCNDWVVFARDKPAQRKTRVKRAAKASILSVEACPVSRFQVQPAEMLTCAECGKVCRGNGGLRAHQFRVDGKRCESRLFAFGSVCRWCMVTMMMMVMVEGISSFSTCSTLELLYHKSWH